VRLGHVAIVQFVAQAVWDSASLRSATLASTAEAQATGASERGV
jgi:hypothetical protein